MEVCLCPQTRLKARHIQGEGVIKIWFVLPKTEISKSIRRLGTEFITLMMTILLDPQGLRLSILRF
jgi:hypothetical protein